MTKNKKIGLTLIILPFALLVVALSASAMSSFVLAQYAGQQQIAPEGVVGLSNSDPKITQLRMLRTGLGLLGIFGVVGILFLTPFGIYFLAKKEEQENVNIQSNAKYTNLTPEQIQFINSWSWGAFFGGWIWPLGNNLIMWFLAMLVPIFNIYAWIKLSIHGRKMAWEQGSWQSFEQFKKRQRTMARLILVLIFGGLALKIIFLIISPPASSPALNRDFSAPVYGGQVQKTF